MKVAVWIILVLLLLAVIGYLPAASSKIIATKVASSLKPIEDQDQNQENSDNQSKEETLYNKIEKKVTAHTVKNDEAGLMASKLEAKL
jgi:hypothetical protein